LAYRRHGSGLSAVKALTHGEWRTRVLLGNRSWLEERFGHEMTRKAFANIAHETAVMCVKEGGVAEAEKLCHDALRAQPDHPGALQLLGWITQHR
jgi:hypothetical protein